MVTRRASIRSRNFGRSGRAIMTMVPPWATMGMASIPAAWVSGVAASSTGAGVVTSARYFSTKANTARWLISTPLGSPVVPPVWPTKAVSVRDVAGRGAAGSAPAVKVARSGSPSLPPSRATARRSAGSCPRISATIGARVG